MSLKKVGKGATFVLATTVLSLTLFTGVSSAEGGLNGIGESQAVEQQPATQAQTQTQVQTQTETTTTQPAGEVNQSTGAESVGSLIGDIGVDAEAAKKANMYMHPIAKMANFLFALILSIAFIGMTLITALDLLYIAVPPVRNMLNPGGGESSGGMGGMGGGFGGGMGGGFGGGMGGGAPAKSKLSRWISDEAVSAAASLNGGGQQGGMMGGGMMGGGFGGGQQEKSSGKSVILDYLKKRAFFLIMFAICAVLLSTTIFTDLGIEFGNWILNRLTGLTGNIPD